MTKITREIERRLAKLDALEAGGVDNWEGYDESLEEWRKEGEIDDLVEDVLGGIYDVYIDAEVDEPAGRGCGYNITPDEDSLKKLLYELVEDVKGLK